MHLLTLVVLDDRLTTIERRGDIEVARDVLTCPVRAACIFGFE